MFVFLDIDGVLNSSKDWKKLYSLNDECLLHFANFMKRIPRGQIILTSSWKTGFLSTRAAENSPQIQLLEQKLAEYGLTIKDKCPTLKGRTRDKEIERYLYFHPEPYCIVDDDKNEFTKVLPHTYFVDAKTGFSKKDIGGALRCLS